MTAPVTIRRVPLDRSAMVVAGVTAAAFLLLFWRPMTGVAAAWWNDPESGHGLLLAPLACWLAYRSGFVDDGRPQPLLGSALVVVGVAIRVVAALAAEAFGGRFAMLLCFVGLVVAVRGVRQVWAWWLPVSLLALAVPLPDLVIGSLALPLQYEASKLGAALLEARGIPVRLDGNVIRLPGRDLFVTEACSGLRSLTALLSLGVLLGGVWLRRPSLRAVLVLLTLPIGVAINGIRVFLTGFLALFVSPKAAEGFTHLTQGWLMFVVALAILAAIAWLLARFESRAGIGSTNA